MMIFATAIIVLLAYGYWAWTTHPKPERPRDRAFARYLRDLNARL